MLNKLYEDNALGTIPQDRYEQMSQKYSEEYYALKTELSILQEQLSAYENAGGRAQKFLKLTERHAAFTDLTPAILNEFISRIEVHERDQKRARYAIQHISIYFNYIGRFENEVTQLAEPTEQEIRQMREEIEEAKKKRAAPTTGSIQGSTGRETLKSSGSMSVSRRGNTGQGERRRPPPHSPHSKTE